MNGRRAKENRKIVSDARRQALEAIKVPVNTALANESDLNARLECVEEWARTFSHLNLWRRLRWLLTGR